MKFETETVAERHGTQELAHRLGVIDQHGVEELPKNYMQYFIAARQYVHVGKGSEHNGTVSDNIISSCCLLLPS